MASQYYELYRVVVFAGTDLRPILPVLARVFDQALAGGGAKNINFQVCALLMLLMLLLLCSSAAN